MGLVSQSVKNLKGGISQQPDILRYPNQGALQINGWSSESEGLQKRPPTTFVKYLRPDTAWPGKPAIHMINRDRIEQYFVVFTGTGIEVVDLLGNSYEVRGYNGYANCANPREDLRMVTVADYTFVVNRSKKIEMTSDLTHAGYPALESRAVVNVRGGQYGRTLKIIVNDVVVATLAMPDGSVAAHVTQTDAQWIAGQLAGQINGTAKWAAEAGQGWLVVSAKTSEMISTIKTEDGYANQLINAFTHKVQTFSKLPIQCKDGYLVEITGESTKSGDNYWVRYDASSLVWRETVKPGIITGVDPATMPHALIRAADGHFDFRPLTWGLRSAGDDNTNPMPSFVDYSINDVFFFRNRLGFLSGENVVMSRTAKYFDFFPASVAELSDDDPIDVAISHNRVSVLKYAVPFSEQLLLWSDQAQFVLTSAGVMSSKTIQLDLTTEFDVSDYARPFGIGRGVYFVSPRASYSSIKRYYAVQDVSDVKSAEDVSAHVPNYIPNTVFALHGSGTENFLTVLSDNDRSCVFVYKFLYLDETVVQQSWGHWEMGEGVEVLSACCIGSFMWLIQRRPGGITLERVEFTKDTVDFSHEPWRAYMDMKVQIQPTLFDDNEFLTRIKLIDLYGFIPNEGDFWTLSEEGVFRLHKMPVGGWASAPELRLDGNMTHLRYTVGRCYEFTYGFSKFLIKQTADDGTSSTEDIGRLQLRRAWVNYEDSGAFEVIVDNGSTQHTYQMSGGRLGSSVMLGRPNASPGQFKFPITGDARRQEVYLFSNAPVPVNIIGCGWEGNYLRRSTGV
ncbi:hypothetical protein [Ectopseudomonas oleovorans]|uniref:Tail tubular protein B n=3 Tax=Bacteria TaxID=2 RepID=A0AA42TUU4_ECTOL|nr:hypothetical protein [Pseudomonas oleovorans]MDH1340562.1 hypothetical protein [Pseudomonas oleovorans]MDH1491534.1 hypothetical protein [Pseudomonas oleovorans]WGG22409.1 hypothetical protein N5O83_06990 [Pseudomonas oleovorans]